MTISSVGASNSIDLISLLSKQSRSSGSGSSTGADATSDSVSLSMQAQFMQGAQQFQTDFSSLGSALQSGDLAGAKKAYSALQNDIQANQPAGGGNDPMAQGFAAIGKALDSGDTKAAQTAYDSMQTQMDKMASMIQGMMSGSTSGVSSTSSTSGTTSSNSFQQDMDELGKLINSGNLDGAKSLLKSMQSKMKAHDNSTQNAPSQSAGSNTDIESLFDSLGKSLNSNDLSSAQDTWNNLIKQFQSSGNTTLG
jgi:soluble cytochrome b562